MQIRCDSGFKYTSCMFFMKIKRLYYRCILRILLSFDVLVSLKGIYRSKFKFTDSIWDKFCKQILINRIQLLWHGISNCRLQRSSCVWCETDVYVFQYDDTSCVSDHSPNDYWSCDNHVLLLAIGVSIMACIFVVVYLKNLRCDRTHKIIRDYLFLKS